MPKGKTLDDFRKNHDRKYLISTRVQAALKELGSSWEYERDFIKRARIAFNEWGGASQTIRDHCIAVPIPGTGRRRGIVAGTKGFAAKLRAQLGKA